MKKIDKDKVIGDAGSAVSEARVLESLINHKGWPVMEALLREQVAQFIKSSNRWKINKCPKCESEAIMYGLSQAMKSSISRGLIAAEIKERMTDAEE